MCGNFTEAASARVDSDRPHPTRLYIGHQISVGKSPTPSRICAIVCIVGLVPQRITLPVVVTRVLVEA